jgi:hypothetical protein
MINCIKSFFTRTVYHSKKDSTMSITREEVLMKRDTEYPLSEEQEKNLEKLLVAVNKLRALYGKPMRVTSGYRPGHYNTKAGGGKRSAHLTLEACDFADKDRALTNFCTDEILEQCGLWMEDDKVATTWIHIQIREPKSRVDGRTRMFKP